MVAVAVAAAAQASKSFGGEAPAMVGVVPGKQEVVLLVHCIATVVAAPVGIAVVVAALDRKKSGVEKVVALVAVDTHLHRTAVLPEK